MNMLAPDVSLVGELARNISSAFTLNAFLQGIMTLTLVRLNIHSSHFTFRGMPLGYPHLCTLIQDTKFVSVE